MEELANLEKAVEARRQELRFKVGDSVEASLGQAIGFIAGTVVKAPFPGQYQCKDCQPRGLAAYEIELQAGRLKGKRVVALKDDDSYVRIAGKTLEIERW